MTKDKNNDINEFLIEKKIYVDVSGAAKILQRAEGTIRNMTHLKICPPIVKRGKKLYFEKEPLEKLRKDREVVEIKKI